MKPNPPEVVSSSRNYITVRWDSWEISEEEDSWYVLEKKDRLLGWHKVYAGFKTQTKVGPLAPGDCYEFRLKVVDKGKESEHSDRLVAATQDDVMPAFYLHAAVTNGPVSRLRKTLAQRPSCVDVPNKFGQTPLRLAIQKNNTTFMGILLNHGADVNQLETGSLKTPLMMAALRGQVEAVQLLLEKGASWQTKDRNGLTAVNYAVDNSQLPVLELAVQEGADINTKDEVGWSVLMRGVILKSSLEVLTYLLENGCDPNDTDSRGQTVLMQAVLAGRPEVIHLLLRKGADISIRNIYGHSAYDMAKNSTSEEIVKVAHLLGGDVEEESSGKTGGKKGIFGR